MDTACYWKWVPYSSLNAINAGYDVNGEFLSVARAEVNGYYRISYYKPDQMVVGISSFCKVFISALIETSCIWCLYIGTQTFQLRTPIHPMVFEFTSHWLETSTSHAVYTTSWLCIGDGGPSSNFQQKITIQWGMKFSSVKIRCHGDSLGSSPNVVKHPLIFPIETYKTTCMLFYSIAMSCVGQYHE